MASAWIFLLLVFGSQCEIATIFTSSMEPTLRASEQGGDRLLWTRLRLRENPPRFATVVALHPNHRGVRLVKRVIGRGGERILLRGGDAWVADPDITGKLDRVFDRGYAAPLRKPAALQAMLFERLPVVEPADLVLDDATDRARLLSESPAAAALARVHAGGLRVEATDAAWEASIIPGAFDRVAQPRQPPEPVADLAFAVRLAPIDALKGQLRIALHDSWRNRTVGATFAIRTAAPTTLDVDGRILARHARPLASDRPLTLRLTQADGRIGLWVDGEALLLRDLPLPPSPIRPRAACRIELSWQGAPVDLQLVEYARDIHWRADHRSDFIVPPRHVLLLGDEGAKSEDARHWRRVRIRDQITGAEHEGDALGVSQELGASVGSNPFRSPDGRYFFRDLHGREWDLGDGLSVGLLPSVPTPYVPIEDVIGQVLATTTDGGGWLPLPR